MGAVATARDTCRDGVARARAAYITGDVVGALFPGAVHARATRLYVSANVQTTARIRTADDDAQGVAANGGIVGIALESLSLAFRGGAGCSTAPVPGEGCECVGVGHKRR